MYVHSHHSHQKHPDYHNEHHSSHRPQHHHLEENNELVITSQPNGKHSHHAHHLHHPHKVGSFPANNLLQAQTQFDEDENDIEPILLNEHDNRHHRIDYDLDAPGVLAEDEDLHPDDPLFMAIAKFYYPPPPIPGCPLGLELLQNEKSIIINQNVEAVEINLGFETANRYDISNMDGKRLYIAAEDGKDCHLWFFAAGRPFKIRIFDYSGRNVLTLWRSCSFLFCLAEIFCFTKFGSIVHVQLYQSEDVGTVHQVACHIREPAYTIHDPDGQQLFEIIGPLSCCLACENDNPTFNIMDVGRHYHLGRIQRLYTGFTRQFYTDADRFEIDFPRHTKAKEKAILLAAVFLIDFLHFEDQCFRGSVLRNNRCRLLIVFTIIIAILVVLWTHFRKA